MYSLILLCILNITLKPEVISNMKISSKFYKKTLLTACVVASMTLGMSTPAKAGALDPASFPIVNNKSNSITGITTTENQMNIVQNGQVGAIIWNSYNIGAGKTVNYDFNTANSLSINRVTGANMSVIKGNITQSGAGGHIMLVNPNGFYFGPEANIDVNGLTVSTHETVKWRSAELLSMYAINTWGEWGDHTDTSSYVCLDDLSDNYGIFIDGSTIKTQDIADNNLNIFSNKIKINGNDNDSPTENGYLQGGIINISNPNYIIIKHDSTKAVFSSITLDTAPVLTTKIKDENGDDVAQDEIFDVSSNSKMQAQEVNMDLSVDTNSLDFIINLDGVIAATEGDINIQANDSINIKNSTQLTAGTALGNGGDISIVTKATSSNVEDKSGDIKVGDGSTLTAEGDINFNTYDGSNNKTTGNLDFGNDITLSSTEGNISLTTGHKYSSNNDGIQGFIKFKNNVDLSAKGNITLLADAQGTNTIGGNIEFGNNTLIDTGETLLIKTSSTIADENKASHIKFGNFDSAETDAHIQAKEIQISTSTSGNLAGDINFGNDMFMKQKVGASSAIDIVSTGGTTSGDVNFGFDNKIEAIKGIIINSSTVGNYETSGDINFNGAINLASTDGGIILKSESNGVNARSGNIVFNGDATLTNKNANIGIISKTAGNGSRSGNIIFNGDATLTNENSVIYLQSLSFGGTDQIAGDITFNGNTNVTANNIYKTGGYFKLESGTSNDNSVSGDITFKGTVGIDSDSNNFIYAYSNGLNSTSGNITFEGNTNINSENSGNFIYAHSNGLNSTSGNITFEGNTNINSENSGNFLYAYSNKANSTSGNITFEGNTNINSENSGNFIYAYSNEANSTSGDITFKKGVNMITKDNIIFRTGVICENSNAGNIIFGDDSSLLSKADSFLFSTYAIKDNSNAGDVIFKGDTDITGDKILFEAGAHPAGGIAGKAGSIYWDNITFDIPDIADDANNFVSFDVLSSSSNPTPDFVEFSDTSKYPNATFSSKIDLIKERINNNPNSGTIGLSYVEPTNPTPLVSKPSVLPEPVVLSKTTDGVFGETQNQQNNANANSSNPELLEVLPTTTKLTPESIQGEANLIMANDVISEMPPSENIFVNDSVAVSPDEDVTQSKTKSFKTNDNSLIKRFVKLLKK